MLGIANLFACLSVAALLASCSCAIESEYWRNESQHRKVTHQTVTAQLGELGFTSKARQTPWTYEKRSAFIKFDERRQILRFHDSFCATPWELLFPSNVSISAVRSSMMRDFKARGFEFRELKAMEEIPQDL